MKKKRIGLLTGGGDCPGLNAVIRAVTKSAIIHHDYDVVGIKDGYEGLVRRRTIRLNYERVSGILTQGGTILGTSNQCNPFRQPVVRRGRVTYRNDSAKAMKTIRSLGLDALVCIGGDGTLTIAGEFQRRGVNVVGVPKTIDNDVCGTDQTFGFDSAVGIVTEAIDRLHSTAQSHHRAMVVETMGRNAGWLALVAGIAGGGDILLIPELPFDWDRICERIRYRARLGKRFSLVVVSEGARPKGGRKVVHKHVDTSPDPIRLGGIGQLVGDEIERRTGVTTRVTVLGHVQRGGTPTPFDRVLATRFGAAAMALVAEKKFGLMVGLKGQKIVPVPLATATGRQRLVSKKCSLLEVARAVGTELGA